jgi:hypothetical protein
MCVYLFVNITKVWSLFRDFILLFLREKSRKTHRENPFFVSRVRSASLADLRMRICYQNNGGSNISVKAISDTVEHLVPRPFTLDTAEQC